MEDWSERDRFAPTGSVWPVVLAALVPCLQTPLEKFSAKMPWNKDKEELKNMKMQKNILDNLTPTQRKNPDLIRAGHRQAIADRIGCVSRRGLAG